MGKKDGQLFERIAPAYGLFYGLQKRTYDDVVTAAAGELDVTRYRRVIDIGCGTGALCAVLRERGLEVTGVDPAPRMLEIARRKVADPSVSFFSGDALAGLPFPDGAFDLVFASYVAHGLGEEERQRLYQEMRRLAAHWVVIHDYNQERSRLVSLVEWLEGGDYFHFIRGPREEMARCVSGMQRCFSEVRVVPVGARACWYVCRPERDAPTEGKGNR